jgi:hypothetical protein
VKKERERERERDVTLFWLWKKIKEESEGVKERIESTLYFYVLKKLFEQKSYYIF